MTTTRTGRMGLSLTQPRAADRETWARLFESLLTLSRVKSSPKFPFLSIKRVFKANFNSPLPCEQRPLDDRRASALRVTHRLKATRVETWVKEI